MKQRKLYIGIIIFIVIIFGIVIVRSADLFTNNITDYNLTDYNFESFKVDNSLSSNFHIGALKNTDCYWNKDTMFLKRCRRLISGEYRCINDNDKTHLLSDRLIMQDEYICGKDKPEFCYNLTIPHPQAGYKDCFIKTIYWNMDYEDFNMIFRTDDFNFNTNSNLYNNHIQKYFIPNYNLTKENNFSEWIRFDNSINDVWQDYPIYNIKKDDKIAIIYRFAIPLYEESTFDFSYSGGGLTK